MVICKEMQKLREYLNEHDIKWDDCSDDFGIWWMCRTHFRIKRKRYSVINGYGSYGGVVAGSRKNAGLLELMINTKEPEGYLTAKKVIERIENG